MAKGTIRGKMRVYGSIEEFQADLNSRFQSTDFSPVFPEIREIVRGSIEENFRLTGRYGNESLGGGSEKWLKSQRAINQSGQTLSDTGQLAASIMVEISQSGGIINIEIGSNKKYAKVHQFGFNETVTINSYTRKNNSKGLKTVQNAVVKSHSRKLNIPKRPYLVLQDEDIEDIKEIILRFMLQGF